MTKQPHHRVHSQECSNHTKSCGVAPTWSHVGSSSECEGSSDEFNAVGTSSLESHRQQLAEAGEVEKLEPGPSPARTIGSASGVRRGRGWKPTGTTSEENGLTLLWRVGQGRSKQVEEHKQREAGRSSPSTRAGQTRPKTKRQSHRCASRLCAREIKRDRRQLLRLLRKHATN